VKIARRICKSSILFLSAVIAAGCFRPMYNYGDDGPPRGRTNSAIHITEERIQMFWNEHGRLPSSTSELPDRPDKSNRTTDGWGRELGWAQIDEKTIRLSSLGKDGKPGGRGDDEDRQLDVIVDQVREPNHSKTRTPP